MNDKEFTEYLLQVWEGKINRDATHSEKKKIKNGYVPCPNCVKLTNHHSGWCVDCRPTVRDKERHVKRELD